MVKNVFQISQSKPAPGDNFFNDILPICISTLQAGGAIVYPTETLYGLGVDVFNNQAIDLVIKLKGRPTNMPIAISVVTIDHVKPLAEISDLASRIIENLLPKPITILLKAKTKVSQRLTGGSDLIGFRFPENEYSKEIIKRFGPITATSANLHGAPNPVTIGAAISQFNDQVGVYLDTGPCIIGEPSTVIDATGDTIRIIRHGACSGNELDKYLRGN